MSIASHSAASLPWHTARPLGPGMNIGLNMGLGVAMLVCAVCGHPSAHAQASAQGGDQATTVHKCTVDGRTVYTDAPCAVGAAAGATAGNMAIKNMPLTQAAIDSKIIWNRYPVKGQDYASLVRSLSANGPKGFHGLASWNIAYQYTTRVQGNVCRFDSIRLTVQGEILMPKWTDEATAPAALRQRWADYYAALQQHEEGHVQHGNELAAMVQEKFLGYGDFACGQAKPIAQSEFDKLYNNLKNRDREYDQRTQHGATQGARF